MKPLVATAPMMEYYSALFPRCHLTLSGFEHFARKIALNRSTFSSAAAFKNSQLEPVAKILQSRSRAGRLGQFRLLC